MAGKRTLQERIRGWVLAGKYIHAAKAGDQREDLRLLWCGDLDHARELLTALPDANTPFELACLELEANHLVAAERSMRQLPDDPTRAVLAGLISTRGSADPYRGGGSSGWIAALETAWRNAGCPDLRASPYLGPDLAQSYDRGDRAACKTASERALWTWMTHRYGLVRRDRPAALLQWAAGIDFDEMADHVVAFNVLAFEKEPRMIKARDRVLEKLQELFPDNFWVRISAFNYRHPENLGPQALAELDGVLAAPNADADLGGVVHDRLHRVASRAGSHSAELMATQTALGSLFITGALGLQSRLLEAKGGLELAVRVGRRMQEDRHLLSYLIGRGYLLKAAERLDHQALFNELARGNDEAAIFTNVSSHLLINPATWPLPSMTRELLVQIRTNELAYYRAALKRQRSTT